VIDLHIHTNASADGQHTPAEIFSLAKAVGLKAIAFTDHNTINSVPEGIRLAKNSDISFVAGIELNTDYHGLDLHLVIYGFGPENPHIQKLIADVVGGMEHQIILRLEKFASYGLRLTRDELNQFSGTGMPTGSSFLKALAAHPEYRSHSLVAPYLPGGARSDSPYVNFYREILRDGPIGIPVQGPSTAEAIRRSLEAKAVPVLAHPHTISKETIEILAQAGLIGLEVFSSYHSRDDIKRYEACAKKLGLLMTSGSDFHGKLFKPDVELGGIDGGTVDLFERLMDRIRSI